MDRYDESRSVSEDDRDEAASSSGGSGILGLGGSPVPKMPGDPSASNDPESVRRRRERAMESDEPMTHEDGDRQRSGATGVDMGSGGQGTNISGE